VSVSPVSSGSRDAGASTSSPPTGTSGTTDGPGSAWAVRLRRPRWTDPRLLVGLVLVAVATVAGSRVVAAADDTEPVWAVSSPVRAGDPVRSADLVATPTRIGSDDAGVSAYLSAGSAPPAGMYTRDLAAGELVPTTAVGESTAGRGVEVPLAVEPGDAPADLAPGDLVDVWAVPSGTSAPPAVPPRAAQVLSGVEVVAVAGPAGGLGATGLQVLLRIVSSPDELGRPLARLSAGSVVLVRVGG
jgi:hypothetical protein